MAKQKITTMLKKNQGMLLTLLAFIFLPFIVGLMNGASPAQVLMDESGQSKFIQGLGLEIFILALYALSYDLIFGFTGLLSFGHAMFFAVGAYFSGILIKNFGLSLGATFLWIIVAGIVQAFLFGMVLPRVKGITFALVTLGMASVFHVPGADLYALSAFRQLPDRACLHCHSRERRACPDAWLQHFLLQTDCPRTLVYHGCHCRDAAHALPAYRQPECGGVGLYRHCSAHYPDRRRGDVKRSARGGSCIPHP